MEKEKVKLSEKDLLSAIFFVAKEVNKKIKPDVVVGIERGGMPLALYLSAYFNVPLERIKVSFYSGYDKKETPTVNFKNFDVNNYSNPLFVDDLIDSGSTMNYIKDRIPNANFATIYKTRGAISPDFYYLTKNPNEWIIFPWDIDGDEDGFNDLFLQENWWKNLLTKNKFII